MNGIFGVKITNLRDNSVVFQGKFKVLKFKPENTDARYKNLVDFYVDQDWLLPIGHTDVRYERADAQPYVRMWFKGGVNPTDLEARLFYNGKNWPPRTKVEMSNESSGVFRSGRQMIRRCIGSCTNSVGPKRFSSL